MIDPYALFDISGRSALITGATGSFGSMAARALAAAGVRLTLAGGNVEKLEALGAEIAEGGGEVELVPRRPLEEEDAEAMVAAAVRAFGGLDLLVTASGTNRVSPIVDFPVAEWDALLAANLRGSWLVCRSAGRSMIPAGREGRSCSSPPREASSATESATRATRRQREP